MLTDKLKGSDNYFFKNDEKNRVISIDNKNNDNNKLLLLKVKQLLKKILIK